MRSIQLVVLIATAALLAVAQTGVPAVTPSLQILTPRSGENLSDDFVTVQYQLALPASASSTPTFQLQLDNHDPVQTTDTQYTFTGLPAGTHTVTVQVVDANNTPLPGVQSQVQFTVKPLATPGAAGTGQTPAPHLEQVSVKQQPSRNPRTVSSKPLQAAQSDDGQLPRSGSALPLLSVIGMGVLVGGIASALRTRHSGNRTQ